MRVLCSLGYSLPVRKEKAMRKVLSSQNPSFILDLSAEVMNWGCVKAILGNILKTKWTLHWVVIQPILLLSFPLAEVEYFVPNYHHDLFFFPGLYLDKFIPYINKESKMCQNLIPHLPINWTPLKAPLLSILARGFANRSKLSWWSQAAGNHFSITLITLGNHFVHYEFSALGV